MDNTISIPVKEIGPIKIIGDLINDEIIVPLATYEKPLWNSVNRGAKISQLTPGIKVSFIEEKMTRSIILQGKDASYLNKIKNEVLNRKKELEAIVTKTSKYAKLINMHFQIVGNLFYIRLEFQTGDASGHNMTTKASDAIITWFCQEYSKLKYVSISGNLCTDKKVSAVNGILGRGKNLIAEINIPKNICEKFLKTTPKEITELNIKKNLIGSILAGSIRSANAHYANILLAMYLALGQDAANIIEGSQGITYTYLNSDDSLYFSITCPNIIVGTVGNGKEYDFVKKYLQKMKCSNSSESGLDSKRLAGIIAATILCSELSLLSAQTNQGELMRAHQLIERKQKIY